MLKGTVVNVRNNEVAARIQVGIGAGNVVTSTITTDSAGRPRLEKDKVVTVVVKASDVIPAVDG